jgi:hypothetical protein
MVLRQEFKNKPTAWHEVYWDFTWYPISFDLAATGTNRLLPVLPCVSSWSNKIRVRYLFVLERADSAENKLRTCCRYK